MESRFKFTKTEIEGVLEIERKSIVDNRGLFTRMFCVEEFHDAGFGHAIKQINRTFTITKGAMRGMHLQVSPNEDHKIISCLSGKVFDVVVDIRKDSPTFLQWRAFKLNAKHLNGILIPPGVAHGFQTLEENCEMLYLHAESYSPHSEMTLNIADPKINIDWPLEVTEISEKDKNCPMIDDRFDGI